jgi:hypothetical protein
MKKHTQRELFARATWPIISYWQDGELLWRKGSEEGKFVGAVLTEDMMAVRLSTLGLPGEQTASE